MDETSQGRARPRRRWVRRVVGTLLVLLLLAGSLAALSLVLYRGPRTLSDVVGAMPNVPLFPLSMLSSRNAAAQHALALPRWLLQRQGAQTVEIALLEVPADHGFVLDWYQRFAPYMGWTLARRETRGAGVRLVFLRGREGLQVIISPNRDLVTAYQLIYLDGLTARQLRQLHGSAPATKP